MVGYGYWYHLVVSITPKKVRFWGCIMILKYLHDGVAKISAKREFALGKNQVIEN